MRNKDKWYKGDKCPLCRSRKLEKISTCQGIHNLIEEKCVKCETYKSIIV